jgi:hypothetical protein
VKRRAAPVKRRGFRAACVAEWAQRHPSSGSAMFLRTRRRGGDLHRD